MPRNTRIEKVEPGDEVSAAFINRLIDEIERVVNFQVTPPLELAQSPGGSLLRLAEDPDTWIKITSAASGTAYAWTEQVPQAGGTFINGPRSGTTSVDPAYELNSSTTVTLNRIVRAKRNNGGCWTFEFGEC